LDKIEGWPTLALSFDHRELRLGITQGSHPSFVVQGDAGEIYGKTVTGKELMVPSRPRAYNLHLCGGSSTRE
jgi:hypothetical protein